MTTDAEIQTALPALAPGNVAVITGGASGIGLAAAKRLASMGMKIVLADIGGARLDDACPRRLRDCRRRCRARCRRRRFEGG